MQSLLMSFSSFGSFVNARPLVDLADRIEWDPAIRPVTGGAFGDVYKCRCSGMDGTSTSVAVKVPRYFQSEDPEKNTKLLDSTNSQIRRELGFFRRLEHPNLVPLLGVLTTCGPMLGVVFPWMSHGTLHSFLENKTFTRVERLQLVHDIGSGLEYLHSNDVFHGDLHSGNVLISEDQIPRISDFGLACTIEKLQPGLAYLQRLTNSSKPGAVRWAAPERLSDSKPHLSGDIYSFGCIMYEVLSGDVPWKEETDYQVIALKMTTDTLPRRPMMPVTLKDEHWTLIVQCLSKRPPQRPTAGEVVVVVDSFISSNTHDSDLRSFVEGRSLVDLTDRIEYHLAIRASGGAFSDVYKCSCRGITGSSSQVAVKVPRYFESPNPEQNKMQLDRLNNEIRRQLGLLKRLEHPNLVPLFGIATIFEPTLGLVFPWMSHGTLHSFLKKETLTLMERLQLVHSIGSGLEYHLHSGNILFDEDQTPRISGFGLACTTEKVQPGLTYLQRINLTNNPGSIRWAAPERLSGSKPHSSGDMYSFGCIMYEVLSGNVPWKELTDVQLIALELTTHILPSRPERVTIRNEHWKLMVRCWSAHPLRRPRAGEIVVAMHAFIKKQSSIPESINVTQQAVLMEATVTHNAYRGKGAVRNVVEYHSPPGPPGPWILNGLL